MFGPGVSTMPSATTVTPKIPLSSTMRIPQSLFVLQCIRARPQSGRVWIVAVPVVGGERGQAAGQGFGGLQPIRHPLRPLAPVAPGGIRIRTVPVHDLGAIADVLQEYVGDRVLP